MSPILYLRPLAVTLLLLQLALGNALTSPPRCACHQRGLVLAQHRNPCGCGSSTKLTPRNELLSMTNGELLKKKNALQQEVDTLQAEVDSELGTQQQELQKLNSMLSEVKGQKQQHHEAYRKQTSDLTDHKATQHGILDVKQAQRVEVHADISKLREHMQLVRSKTAYLTGILAGCDTSKCSKAISLLKALPTSGLVAVASAPSPQYALVFEVEALEKKRADLEKQKSKQIMSFSNEQRHLLDRIDVAKIELNGQKIVNRDSEDYVSKTKSNLEQQMNAVDKSLDSAKEQLQRLEEDKKAADEHLSGFEAEIKRCGCWPR
mmetsp:Transcript_105785/g.183889  ORF Transcript_105785/g.183889 Transcript_105785/m.183889 type:complete len:320 (+) Transcript_105785:106-1065(+)